MKEKIKKSPTMMSTRSMTGAPRGVGVHRMRNTLPSTTHLTATIAEGVVAIMLKEGRDNGEEGEKEEETTGHSLEDLRQGAKGALSSLPFFRMPHSPLGDPPS